MSQILDRIERIEASGVDRERFLKSEWDQDAVARNLEIIGEAVKRLSAELRAGASKFRWNEWAGYRDVAIHSYDTLDLERTWRAVAEDLPALKTQVRKLLRNRSGPDPPGG